MTQNIMKVKAKKSMKTYNVGISISKAKKITKQASMYDVNGANQNPASTDLKTDEQIDISMAIHGRKSNAR